MITVENKHHFICQKKYIFDEKHCQSAFKSMSEIIDEINQYKIQNNQDKSVEDLFYKSIKDTIIFRFNDKGFIVDDLFNKNNINYDDLNDNDYYQNITVSIVKYVAFHKAVDQYIVNEITENQLYLMIKKIFLTHINKIIASYYKKLFKDLLTDNNFVENFVYNNKLLAITCNLLQQIPVKNRNEIINYKYNTPIMDKMFYKNKIKIKITFLGLYQNIDILTDFIKDDSITYFEKAQVIKHVDLNQFKLTATNEIKTIIAEIINSDMSLTNSLRKKDEKLLLFYSQYNQNLSEFLKSKEVSFEKVFENRKNVLKYDLYYDHKKIILSQAYLDKIHFYEKSGIYYINILLFEKLLMSENQIQVTDKEKFIKQIKYFILHPDIITYNSNLDILNKVLLNILKNKAYILD